MKYSFHTLFKFFIGASLVLLIVMFGCEKPDPEAVLKPMIDTYINAWNTGNLDALDAIADPQFEFRMTPTFKATVGLDSLKQIITYYRTAYPDFHLSIDDEIYDENKAAIIWTIIATNTGSGVYPPTGKQINVQGMSIYHIVNGKIFDEWIAGNNLLWYQQLGFTLIPPGSIEN